MITVDYKEESIKDIEAQLKTVTIANGYDFDLTVLEGIDWLTSDQIKDEQLPVAFVHSEDAEEYNPQGNVLSSIITTIPIYVYAKKDKDVQANNRAKAFQMRRNIKKAMQKFTRDYGISHTDWGSVPICFLSRIRTDTGWSADMVIVEVIMAIKYDEPDY